MVAVSTLLITGLILVMSISVARADSIEISSNDISQIYAFIVVSCGVFAFVIIAHIMNVRTIQKNNLQK